MITLDLAVYEAVNCVWEHEFLLRDIKSGFEHLSILEGPVETGSIQLIHLYKDALKKAYSLAAKNNGSVYDSSFVCLALELGSELSALGRRQIEIFE